MLVLTGSGTKSAMHERYLTEHAELHGTELACCVLARRFRGFKTS